MKELIVRSKRIELPAFFPDATFGCVRGVSSNDLVSSGIGGVVVNVYHLLHKGLIKEIEHKKGIHNYMEFNGLIISDSGGFQVMSLIREDSKYGEINNNGAVFIFNNKKIRLTPKKCIEMQLKIKSDIIMCLDDCAEPELSYGEQIKSVKRTIKWAEKCKNEFDKLTKNLRQNEKPLIFAIIQGGNNLELRKKCADELIKIGFDGYAFGGWPVDKKGKFLDKILKYTCELMPNNKPKYAMGVGKPENIVKCVRFGYNMFDCVIPTREARNNRLYAFKNKLFGIGLFGLKRLDEKGKFYKYVRVRNLKHKNDNEPISKNCDCYICKNFSRAQIYQLFKGRNEQAVRLTTIHNLRFYSKLMERLQEK